MKVLYYYQTLVNRMLKGIWNCLFKIQLFLCGIEFKRVSSMHSIPILKIHPNSKVKIGDKFQVNNYDNVGWFTRTLICVRKNAILKIGNNVGLSSTCLYCSKSISIGDNVKIGGGSRVYDTNFHNVANYILRRSPSSDGPKAESKPVVIEDDVFIGTNCIIGKGVIIGARSIIAAGSVVTKSIPSDEVWGGNPAKYIKKINNSFIDE